MENISWTDQFRKYEVLRRVKEGKNILQTIKRRQCSWIGYSLFRKCLLNNVIEGKIELRIYM